jgi:hypothetical protein
MHPYILCSQVDPASSQRPYFDQATNLLQPYTETLPFNHLAAAELVLENLVGSPPGDKANTELVESCYDSLKQKSTELFNLRCNDLEKQLQEHTVSIKCIWQQISEHNEKAEEKLERLLREQADCHIQLLQESQDEYKNNLAVLSKELSESTRVVTIAIAKEFAGRFDTLCNRFGILESRVDILEHVDDTGTPTAELLVEAENGIRNDIEEFSAGIGNRHCGSHGGPPLTLMPTVRHEELINLLGLQYGQNGKEKTINLPQPKREDEDDDDPFAISEDMNKTMGSVETSQLACWPLEYTFFELRDAARVAQASVALHTASWNIGELSMHMQQIFKVNPRCKDVEYMVYFSPAPPPALEPCSNTQYHTHTALDDPYQMDGYECMDPYLSDSESEQMSNRRIGKLMNPSVFPSVQGGCPAPAGLRMSMPCNWHPFSNH